jgi:predicted metal-dependent phosphoesterase TrpH
MNTVANRNSHTVTATTKRSKADLHLHTTFSDGYLSPADTIDLIARETDLSVIAITDHDTTEGAFLAQSHARQHYPHLEVIIGQEITTGDGDVLGLFLTTTLPEFDTAAQAIAAVHDQDGLAIAAHPFVFGWGVESVGQAIRSLPFDAVETRHGFPLSLTANVRASLVNRSGQKLPAVGNSDSHIPFTAGQAFTWFPGQTADDLRHAIITNQVRAGGTIWQIPQLFRTLQFLRERGPIYGQLTQIMG